MIVLLSPAKIMNMSSAGSLQIPGTQPVYQKDAEVIAAQLQRLTVEDLMQHLDINRELAELNYMRYMQFDTNINPAKQAMQAYDGVVYQKFNAATLNTSALQYAQDRILILSALYGFLRPLDVIKAYRLAFKMSLPALSPGTLYDYWRARLTDALVEMAHMQGSVIVDLASQEISRAIDWKRVDPAIRVVRPVFKDQRPDGRYRTVVIYTKQARGSMARFIIDERISQPDDLLAFDADGYYYNPVLSTADIPVFTR